jgi:glycine cleavage system transcriptional repressor
MPELTYIRGMKEFAVLSCIGTDRVGIADDIASTALKAGCNIEESRMAVLGGEFAAVVLVSGESDALKTIEAKVREKSILKDLDVSFKWTEAQKKDVKSIPYQLETVSLNTPGIVHSITGLLTELHINVEDLETETRSAPWTGAPMFKMKLRMIVPNTVSIAQLKAKLAHLAEEQDFDISLSSV